jgi:hypothetical protein
LFMRLVITVICEVRNVEATVFRCSVNWQIAVGPKPLLIKRSRFLRSKNLFASFRR